MGLEDIVKAVFEITYKIIKVRKKMDFVLRYNVNVSLNCYLQFLFNASLQINSLQFIFVLTFNKVIGR